MEAPLAVATALDAVASITPGGLPVEVAGLLALVADVQQLRNRLDGLVNDVFHAVARVDDAARRDQFGDEDPGLGFIGRVALQSQVPELVAPCLGVSVRVAENRVLTALELAERAPVLVEEMRAGRVEAFRAGLVHQELADAPAVVEDEIVARLVARADRVGGWSETAGPLLRRTRSLLAKLAPEVLAERVAAARELRGLHKRGESECLDRWDGLYHVEDSRMAWAAIDDLARELLAAGAADTLAQARADAHMRLLLEHCDVTVHVHATAPGAELAEQTRAARLGHAQARPATETPPTTETPPATETPPTTETPPATETPPTAETPPALTTRPASESFPLSESRAAREPTMPAGTETADATGPTGSAPVFEVGGFGGPGSILIRRGWLTDALASGRAVLDTPVRCHPDSGAILDGAITKGFTRADTPIVTGDQTDRRYRIPAPMARLVRFRDRQCRFPGCAISSRFCDLDHVVAWPDGPTSPANLMALCRRHHRLKQSPGWRVVIHPDLTVTWTDPIGRTQTSYPPGHLGLLDDWRALPEHDGAKPGADSTRLSGPDSALPGDDAAGVRDVRRLAVRMSPLEAHLSRLLAA